MNKFNHRQHKSNPKQGNGINFGQIEPAMLHLEAISEKLLHSNQDCLIPITESESHSKNMRNCHIIGEKFLERIAIPKGKVLMWPASAKHIGKQAIEAIKCQQNLSTIYPLKLERLNPIAVEKNTKDCKYTIACHEHDNKAFSVIDTIAHFNRCDKETRFKIAMRCIVAYAAWYQGHKRWVEYDFEKDPRTQLLIAKYPQAYKFVEQIKNKINNSLELELALTQELQRWQQSYRLSDWGNSVTTVGITNVAIRIAGTGIQSRNGYVVMTTILPSDDHQAEIFATSIKNQALKQGLPDKNCLSTTQKEVSYMKNLLNNADARDWLPYLAKQFEFLYVCPEDYYNLPEDERNSIEENMAEKLTT